MELIDFQDKKWKVITKIRHSQVKDHKGLKEQYEADLVLSDKQSHYYILELILDAEFEELNKE